MHYDKTSITQVLLHPYAVYMVMHCDHDIYIEWDFIDYQWEDRALEVGVKQLLPILFVFYAQTLQ